MEERTYREYCIAEDLTYYNVTLGESDLMIATKEDMSALCRRFIRDCREDLIGYIRKEPFFKESLAPMDCPEDSPQIVKMMCSASIKAHVGPMAAVAGAISQLLCEYLAGFTDEIIIENGGDNCILTSKGRTAGIYAGSGFPEGLKIAIDGRETPWGICTSSGTMGHSFSFGSADAVTIISDSAALSDAAATYTANNIRDASDIESALEKAMSIDGIRGAVIIAGGKLGAMGEVRFV